MARNVSLTAGRDPHSYTRYEFHLMEESPVGSDRWQTLATQSGFKSKSTAANAGRRKAVELGVA